MTDIALITALNLIISVTGMGNLAAAKAASHPSAIAINSPLRSSDQAGMASSWDVLACSGTGSRMVC